MAIIFLAGSVGGTLCSDDACCPYELAQTGTGSGDAQYTAIDTTFSNVCVPSDKTMTVSWAFYAVVANQFLVYADGIEIFDTGCTTGTSATTFVIPAGTTSVRYLLYGACNAPQVQGDQWEIYVSC